MQDQGFNGSNSGDQPLNNTPSSSGAPQRNTPPPASNPQQSKQSSAPLRDAKGDPNDLWGNSDGPQSSSQFKQGGGQYPNGKEPKAADEARRRIYDATKTANKHAKEVADPTNKDVAVRAAKKGAYVGATKVLNGFGVPVSTKQLEKYVPVFAKIWAGVLAFILVAVTILVVGDGESTNRTELAAGLELSADLSEDLLPNNVLIEYQRAALAYEDRHGPIPWSIIAAIGAVASEHGRFSPYDQCDRRPGTMSALYPQGPPVSICSEAEESFPQVTPAITPTDGESGGIGPFLFTATAAANISDPQSLQHRGNGGAPQTAVDYLAWSIAETRAVMIETEGWDRPDFTGAAAVTNQQYGDSFWTELVSRLPIVNPRSASCQTPRPAHSTLEISSAISAVWRCELARSELFHVETSTAGWRIEESQPVAADLIVKEALQVAWTWSGYGERNTGQHLCGREPRTAVGTFGGSDTFTVLTSTATSQLVGVIDAYLVNAGAAAPNVTVTQMPSPNPDSIISPDNLYTGTVIVSLGTSSTSASYSELVDLVTEFVVSQAAGAHVVWVLEPGDNVETLNDAVTAVARQHTNLSTVDWLSLSDGHSDWFAASALSTTGAQQQSEIIVNELLRHTESITPPAVGGTDSANYEAVDGNEPVGVFPMTQRSFDEFNPVAGASRCDLGANIHAAVLQFIAGESVHPDDRPAKHAGSFEVAIGGWKHFPLVLGNDPTFTTAGPRTQFEPSAECAARITNWVNDIEESESLYVVTDGVVTQQAFVANDPTGDTALTAVGYDNEQGETPVGHIDCFGRLDGSVELAAVSEAAARLAAYDTATDVEGIDEGVDDIYADLAATTEFGEPTDINFRRANLDAATKILSAVAAANEYSPTAAPQLGVDPLVIRLSHARRAFPPAPTPPLAEADFASGLISIAIATAGLYEGDQRVTATPFATAAFLAGTTTGTATAIAGVPPSLLAAVNAAIDNIDNIYAGCNMDAAYLLATSYKESGAWWDDIQADGQMSPPLLSASQPPALGPFQMKQATFDEQAANIGMPHADGNGDSILDVHNAYDSARAAVRYQCRDADTFDGDLMNDDTMWWVALRYNDGSYPSQADERRTEECIELGEHLKVPTEAAQGCMAEAYATMRVAQTKEYRAAIQAAVAFTPSDPNFDPNSVAGRAVTYALNQVGLPYCKPSQPEKCPVPVSTLRRNFTWDATPSSDPTSGNYRFGPDAFDCSGLVFAAYWHAGINIEQTVSRYQYANLPKVSAANLLPGDLLFYSTSTSGGVIGHVTMYIGDGQMVHAASSKWGVITGPANLDPTKGFEGATRPSLIQNPKPGADIGDIPDNGDDTQFDSARGVGIASPNFVAGFETDLDTFALAYRDRRPGEVTAVVPPSTDRGIIDGFDGEEFDAFSTREGAYINGYAAALRSLGRGDEFRRGIILRSLSDMKPVVPGVITAVDGREFTGRKVNVTVDGETVQVSTLMSGDTIYESFAATTSDSITLTYTYDSGVTEHAYELSREQWDAWIRAGVTLTPQAVVEGGIPGVDTIVGNIGDSAGLLNSIMFRDYLRGGTATDFTIAATGSVSPLGQVEQVGGVYEKVLAAIDADADVVFVPKANYQEGVSAAEGNIKVVGVVSSKDAYRELCNEFDLEAFCAPTQPDETPSTPVEPPVSTEPVVPL